MDSKNNKITFREGNTGAWSEKSNSLKDVSTSLDRMTNTNKVLSGMRNDKIHDTNNVTTDFAKICTILSKWDAKHSDSMRDKLLAIMKHKNDEIRALEVNKDELDGEVHRLKFEMKEAHRQRDAANLRVVELRQILDALEVESENE